MVNHGSVEASPVTGEQKLVSLVGPSGAGKSTVAMFIQRLVPKCVIISIAQPLRDIEEYVYRILMRPSPRVTGAQDGRLLQTARTILMEREPKVLERIFMESLEVSKHAPLVVNDDCRRAMKPLLVSRGFQFIFIDADHKGRRPDLTPPEVSTDPHDQVLTREECDLVLSNAADLHALLDEVTVMLFESLRLRMEALPC